MRSSAILAAALAAIPASAHIGFFDPSALDYNGNGYTLATPLANLPFNSWWFHGNIDREDRSAAPFVLPVGGTVITRLGCNRKSAESDSTDDPCPSDTPSMHAGSPVRDAQLRGCGLAIAYKSEYSAVQPEDFTIFSVNTECVKTNKTPFQVPAAMPACPEGGCICSWFWQGQESADEMYMTGFRCTVEGGTPGASLEKPQPPVFCRDSKDSCVSAPKQPMYWANDRSNVDYEGYDKKPAYNADWGFSDGPQNIGMIGGGGQPAPPVEQQPNVPAPVPTTMVTRTRPSWSRPTKAPESCSWPGHCAGARCNTWDDCSDDLICIRGRCGRP